MRVRTWKEFFEVNGTYAMRNLTIFIGVSVGSLVVIYLALMDKLTTEIFVTYMLATGGVYSFGKWQDDRTKRCEMEASAPLPEPPGSVTNITNNQPDKVNVSAPNT